ncbi:hypothetical protein BB12_20810 [Salmonella enterica subsp. diarizonae]|uniref:Uncharacterized protein n=1 Tax=Salmonella enterica TaxID=28901 RepID=A0A633DLV9_SALER|nr:hypothetical protein CHC34_04815 [Salmonella enterica]EBP4183346.1 hypothetical protein [Salmonella enterica subsp. diarizonae]EBQ9478685.1 hypothetical protein [Salmonella enterica subsp. enterica serovar Kokomlemle]EBU9929680.1 hypothetical protein [Salmonella enterica subsp. enterica serovar Thompson]EBW2603267.1 hypothetical protein [Salmonella enterica subsp. enterica serovar Poano]EBY8714043.1 hypothetical protein [Salmonella enterica subsp. enterica serovar Kottbus]EDT7666046.1 hypo
MMADLPPVSGYQHSTKLSDITLPDHGRLEAVIMSGLAGSFPIIRGMNKVTGAGKYIHNGGNGNCISRHEHSLALMCHAISKILLDEQYLLFIESGFCMCIHF